MTSISNDLSQEEIEEELWDYIKDRIEWSYEQIN